MIAGSGLTQTIHPAPQDTASPRHIAQVQAVATPPTNPPGPGAPAAANQTTPTASQDMVKLQFPNSDVQDVLRFYEALTGKRVVTDNFVQGKVNISVSGSVPHDEAV